MRRTTASIIAASTAIGLCLSGCSSGQLNTEQSCNLLNELAIEQSIGDKWGWHIWALLSKTRNLS
ncbi:hypothetical protein [Glutamicibacter nicotianae]|uniref:hypothetical protein n=1 Tax=Glutamicibacter nicotianae TaxID=37929 RepID=UPI00195DC847|nr:hypothetical protein [Glutamicibacter nicotianae]MBM7769086.1 hypothetical protein [Glutamicibacter nicotianae]